MKLAILFGGLSNESNVSITSALSIIKHLNKNVYDIYPIYISKDALFYKCSKKVNKEDILNMKNLKKIANPFKYLKEMDVVFPVLHGSFGEDGKIQGFLEVLNVPYVGSSVLASALCMDKVYTKKILNEVHIEQAKSIYLKKDGNNYIYYDDSYNKFIFNEKELKDYINGIFNYPIFVKPASSGSSIGVSKVQKEDDLIHSLKSAFLESDKVLIEEGIIGREVECGVLGNKDLIISTVGEVISNSDFYSYDAKYKSDTSYTVVPADDISSELIKNIQKIAKKAYIACNCRGLARIDFFIEYDTNRIILNEINTIPGFTNISMYPKLMQEYGFSYSTLLDKLISLAKERD